MKPCRTVIPILILLSMFSACDKKDNMIAIPAGTFLMGSRDTLLFHTELTYLFDLDERKITGEFRNAFEDHGGVQIPKNIAVSIIKKQERWQITDKDLQQDTYIVTKDEDRLSVYRAGGYPSEYPQHTVYLDEYYIGKYEVTNLEFKAFVDATGYLTQIEENGWGWVWIGEKWKKVEGATWKTPLGPDSDIREKMAHPVVQVSWNDAMAYCRWLSQKTGKNYTLPTEAQWEKAARGTTENRWAWGNEWDGTRLNFADTHTNCPWSDKSSDDGYADTAPVGSYPTGANLSGLMDMSGNVWEWCADWFHPAYYRNSSDTNPTGPESGQGRVIRGGGWYTDKTAVRCAQRYNTKPSVGDAGIGFRVVRLP